MWMVRLLAFDICSIASFLFPLLSSLEFFKCGKAQRFGSRVKYQKVDSNLEIIRCRQILTKATNIQPKFE